MKPSQFAAGLLRGLIVLIAGVLIAAWVLLATARGAEPPAGAGPSWAHDPERVVSGDVLISLTPKGLTGDGYRVDVLVSTHVGDLRDLDLMTATELRLDGRSYRPVKATRLGGHHAGGQILFPLDRAPAAFEIVIRGVRTMGDLVFRWP